ncbi:MAG: shikimate dehydrogenase [Burkholderiaceae bacterium]
MTSSASTQRFAVIGNPVSHSRSPSIHMRFAQQLGIDLAYTRIEAPIDDFEQVVTAFFEQGGRGLNVTVPFKARAHVMASAALSTRAAQAAAVNTLWHDGTRIHGCNTDGVGLLGDLIRLGAWSSRAHVLIVGAGGAARGVVGPFLDATQGEIRVVNRTAVRAHELVNAFGGPARLSAGALADACRSGGWDIVINATSSSLSDAAPDLPAGLYASGSWAYDMMYGSAPTPFMRQAQADGAVHTADGLGMLVGQAAESFSIWHGVQPDVQPVLTALRAELDLAA